MRLAPFLLLVATTSAHAGEGVAMKVGKDGEPLDEDGDVIFQEETAETVRPEGEDPPTAPLPPPPVDPDAPPPDPLHPQHRIEYNNLLGVRYNALGLVDRFDLFYRYRLYDDPGALYREGAVGIGITPWISPAFIRIGPMVEVRPLTILTFQAGYFFNAFFGTFNQLQGFASALEAYDDDTLDARNEAGIGGPTTGGEFQATAQLLLKVGNVVLRDTVGVFVSHHDIPGGGSVYYEQTNDILRSNDQPTVVNDLDLVYLTDFSLIAGARFNQTKHFYAARDFRPGEPTDDPNGPTLRIGPLFAYRFGDVNRNLQAPTVLLLANWWLSHRYRTGATVSPAIPNISAAFVIKGDVWNSDVGLVTDETPPPEAASIPSFRGL